MRLLASSDHSGQNHEFRACTQRKHALAGVSGVNFPIVIDVPGRANQAIMILSDEAGFRHCRFAKTVCGKRWHHPYIGIDVRKS